MWQSEFVNRIICNCSRELSRFNCRLMMLVFVRVYSRSSTWRTMKSNYTEILEVHVFEFAYRLFHEDLSPIYEAS